MDPTTCAPAPTGADALIFEGTVLKRDDGVVTFNVSPNPRDPKAEVFYGDEALFLTKGDVFRVTATPAPRIDEPATSNVGCGWTLTESGQLVSTDQLQLPDNGLVTLAVAAGIGLGLAFGLVIILLAIKSIWVGFTQWLGRLFSRAQA
jgi:hypothetical protein